MSPVRRSDPGETTVEADLTDAEAVRDTVRGVDVVVLGRAMGYEPLDDAETYAARLGASDGGTHDGLVGGESPHAERPSRYE